MVVELGRCRRPRLAVVAQGVAVLLLCLVPFGCNDASPLTGAQSTTDGSAPAAAIEPVPARPVAVDTIAPAEIVDALTRSIRFFASLHPVHGYVSTYPAEPGDRKEPDGVVVSECRLSCVAAEVGRAYLAAYDATDRAEFLAPAVDIADVLVRTQLRSGGWPKATIRYGPGARRDYAFRVDSKWRRFNETSLDNDVTPSALRFLLEFDRLTGSTAPEVREAVEYALDRALCAQYPNGAWPQAFRGCLTPRTLRLAAATIDPDWPRRHVPHHMGIWYKSLYTLNDGVTHNMLHVMLMAGRQFSLEDYWNSAERAGGFLLLAQLPEPQPGWAQQYDFDMRPAWARPHEPPAVVSRESMDVMWTLLRLYQHTGDPKYMRPLPRAIAYFRTLTLEDGTYTRFYELLTDRPLYINSRLNLIYEKSDFQNSTNVSVDNEIDEIALEYERLVAMSPDQLESSIAPVPGAPSPHLVDSARQAIYSLDPRGAWGEPGEPDGEADGSGDQVIRASTFIRNVGVLTRLLIASREGQ